ncbi:MAG: MerR family transcriptional regulator [Candidatus Kerfeldbacteria bacterium]|nr:MerR family transcriptional regulator [Candidatus Kerfeldbacteria bacterium]
MSYTVQQLATLAGITVRALHHYDQIGLLKPSSVRKNGYREYEKAELLRLQQILFFRELDVSLHEIKRILNRPDFVVVDALRGQRVQLQARKRRLERLLKTIDTTITHMNKKNEMNDSELYDAFKDPDVAQYQDEVKQRWGNTDAYKQSMVRVSKMTKAEMDALKKNGKAFIKRLGDVMASGAAVDSEEMQKMVAGSYKNIQFFYDCSLDMFRQLGEMYVADPRFTKTYDSVRPGLAVYYRDAIRVYCTQNA